MIDNLFDIDCDNVHMIKVDDYEAVAVPEKIAVGFKATHKQLDFLKSLFAERQGNEVAMIMRQHLLEEHRNGKLSVKMASDAISELLEIPKDQQSLPIVNALHGELWVTKTGLYVRVKQSQSSGNLYGLVWNDYSNQWVYTPGIMSDLDHKITAEEAAAWGHEHQWCIFCSRPLSDPRSELVGYGQVCARKHRLPWGEAN